VLSACNTAARDKPGAEGLSGLARAFFYAGARSLLVSHWPVDSHAAVRLTTGAFTELRKHPDIGRTEALRRSMQALIADRSSLRNADPSIWAPFVLVGEGSQAKIWRTARSTNRDWSGPMSGMRVKTCRKSCRARVREASRYLPIAAASNCWACLVASANDGCCGARWLKQRL
jgi:hypothetical protein